MKKVKEAPNILLSPPNPEAFNEKQGMNALFMVYWVSHKQLGDPGVCLL